MSETKVRRRGFGEDGIYLDAARNRYMGAISLGYGPDGKRIRRKVSGKTKQEVRAKLQALHQEMNAGVRSSSTYTVRQAVEDWLREGLDGTSERTRTLMLLCLSRGSCDISWSHFGGPEKDVELAVCWVADKTGMGVRDGTQALIRSRQQQVREMRPGTADESFEGQQVRGSRISGQAVPGALGR